MEANTVLHIPYAVMQSQRLRIGISNLNSQRSKTIVIIQTRTLLTPHLGDLGVRVRNSPDRVIPSTIISTIDDVMT